MRTIRLIMVPLFLLSSCAQKAAEENQLPIMEATSSALQLPTAVAPSYVNVTQGPDIASFSPDSASNLVPDDILQEVYYYGQGGGRGFADCPGTDSVPRIENDPIDAELMSNNSLVTCGWPSGQELAGTITYPDGRKILRTLKVNEDGTGKLSLRPLLSDPQGIYEYQIAGNGISFVSNAYFYNPSAPRAYELDDQTLLLHNFDPREKIRLIRYSCDEFRPGPLSICDPSASWKFDSWQEYTVGESGQLLISAAVDRGFYYVVGTAAFEIGVWSLDWGKERIEQVHRDAEFSRTSWNELYEASIRFRRCASDVNSRVKISNYESNARAATFDGATLKLYANPRTNSRVKLEIQNGSAFEIRGEYSTAYDAYVPICFDQKVWWVASIQDKNDHHFGYVIESDERGRYYFEQINDEPSEKDDAVRCGGLKSRLARGDKARVAFTDGANMRIRASAGFSQQILNKVPEGTLITILSGPKCADNSTWWRIRTEGGLEGWMTEEQDGVYLLEPLP